MNSLIVIAVTVSLAIILFPLHIDNYIYFNSVEKYASVNVALYRFIRVFNVNTVAHSVRRMHVNGKDKDIDAGFFKSNMLKIYNNLSVTKIIQLGDYGIAGQGGAYAAVAQNAVTQAVYSFATLNGGNIKLKNYIILNREHDGVVYYAKISGVINLLAAIKIMFILMMEKMYEQIKK